MTWNLSALAGNRTRVNCLGSSYAHHYTTNACNRLFKCRKSALPLVWEMKMFWALWNGWDKMLHLLHLSVIPPEASHFHIHTWYRKWHSLRGYWTTAISRNGLLRWPGIEPGSTAWKAAMLTTIPPTHVIQLFKVCTALQRDKVIQEIIQVFTIVLNAQVSQFAYFDHCGFR